MKAFHQNKPKTLERGFLLLALLVLISLDVNGQVLTPLDIPVVKGSKQLHYPFAGGMSAPQFSEIDLDNDGQKDLFVFDRNGNVVSTYLNKGYKGVINYAYAPEYVSLFPNIHTWCLLHDFNGDGIEDIFKAPDVLGVAGIEVWRGSRENGQLKFTKIKNPSFPADVLTYRINGSVTNIYVSIVDILGIYDLDNDGDTDILTFEPDGSYLYSYVNKAVENGFGRDTFVMEFSDRCFGKFIENQFNEQITLSPNSGDCANFFNNRKGDRHTGSTITPFDADCDGDVDLLLGDVSGEYLTFLKNGSNTAEAWFTDKDNRWPSSDTSVRIQSFPAAYLIDANNDGFKDVVIASNESNSNQNVDNVWLYLHQGDSCTGNYVLATKNFLIEEMLHFGTGCHPAFLDVNNDGLQDIVVGSNGIAQAGVLRQNRLFLLLNNGTPTQPSFSLASQDFLQLSKLTTNFSRLAPCSGDIDGDGDQDLFLGNSNGTLMFFRNDNFQFNLISTEYQNIFVGPNSSPVLFDFDQDGLLDFIIGESNNSLNFYKNKGTKTLAIFDEFSDMAPNSENVGKLFDKNNFATQNGSPEIFNTREETYLLMGFNFDSLSLYRVNSTNPETPFTLLKKNVLPEKLGRRLNPAATDLNNDGKMDFAVGNERGGMSIYTSDINMEDVITGAPNLTPDEIQIFPVPADNFIFIKNPHNKGNYKVFDTEGRLRLQGSFDADFRISVQSMNNGVYYIFLQSEGLVFRKAFSIVR